jgi:hypothetical protein
MYSLVEQVVFNQIRRIDGQALVPLVITELNGRPISIFSKVQYIICYITSYRLDSLLIVFRNTMTS